MESENEESQQTLNETESRFFIAPMSPTRNTLYFSNRTCALQIFKQYLENNEYGCASNIAGRFLFLVYAFLSVFFFF